MRNIVYCGFCNRDVKPIEKYENISCYVKNIEVTINEHRIICPICNNDLLNYTLDENMIKIDNAYLKHFGLSFGKLKEIRTSLNLSQELFAKALNWSKKSVIRYENADSIPQNEYITVYQKIAKDINEFFVILKNNKDKMDSKTYYKIFNRASTNININLKSINSLVYLLQDNNLNKTQIMKNTFAIDIQNYKTEENYISNNNYAHGFYGPIINNWEGYLQYMVRQGYIGFTATEEDIIFFTYEEPDLSLFTESEIETMKLVKDKLKGKSAAELTKWSHNFKGWKDTKNGEIIDPKKYAKYFSLDEGWE